MKKPEVIIGIVGVLALISLIAFHNPVHQTLASEKTPRERAATVTLYNMNGGLTKEWRNVRVTYNDDMRIEFEVVGGGSVDIKGGTIVTEYK